MQLQFYFLLGDFVTVGTKNLKDDQNELSEEVIFTLLSARRRRELLRILNALGGEATSGDVTTEIVGKEHGADGDAAKRKAVYVSMHQTHVPRLVEAGVLEFNETKKTIRLTGPWRQLYAYLEFDPFTKKQGLLSRMFRPQTKK
ncbi:hypothetical protein EGH22_16765 [Halomicroarcula sp. F28]|uniref:DUF7344 domain-containing protein n=1 Tax=Haloarcula salinisoli TaxID=2487746 RepID=UPI001C72D839|nr:hypothetical protein [Halomicroarcula salinisoli]MBX0287987.1 hypothetical protein [Halomicroarcula salinisoli]